MVSPGSKLSSDRWDHERECILTCIVVEIVRSTTVAVLTWICPSKKSEPQPLRRRICCGLRKSKQRLNVGNRQGASHSQISTFTQRHLPNFFLSRIFASSTMSPRSRANSESTTLATSPSGPDKYHCKWQAWRAWNFMRLTND
jgi:hypothetical protein